MKLLSFLQGAVAVAVSGFLQQPGFSTNCMCPSFFLQQSEAPQPTCKHPQETHPDPKIKQK